jgi:hypothetical protein
MKITEITVTDERGEEHTLRCSKGLDVDVDISGTLYATTAQAVQPNRTLVFPAGRYICYRLTRED